MASEVLVLSYAACGTCKKALKWLSARGIAHALRDVTIAPPTPAELGTWIPKSKLPVRKWLNTSGQSYRALGKDKIARATDEPLVAWLAADGRLVKRPVLVAGAPDAPRHVLVGFSDESYEGALAKEPS
jgi:arsenate reductase